MPPFRVNGPLDIYNAGTLQAALEQHIQSHSSIEIDLTNAGGLDVAGLQLLYSARKSAEASGKPFALAGVPDALRSLEAALGLP
jgi:anti-anti-sigma factor